ncbi:MAG TPA: helix-turn-helix transcriptional regulator [Solirubrobacteraceae bacterium]|nr:helix-turn-helix transcriptional regulator [Solirubrobacteraceae bacterium]
MARETQPAPPHPDLASLSGALRELIKCADLTQGEVADHADGLDAKQVNSYVCGRVNPGYFNLRRLCRGIGIKPVALMAAIEAIEEGEDGGRAVADRVGEILR